MYSEIIANRLNNLKYLSPLKKSNVTILSKSNKFGDVVKFFAQINENNVFEKITFKATGCSAFLSLCDYFCEIITGKNIDDDIQIIEKELVEFATLDSSKEHVYAIILDTFKLLIKKYKKGVEKNKITPIPLTVSSQEVKKETKSISKKEKIITNSDLDEILIKNDSEKSTKKPLKKKLEVSIDPKTEEKVVIKPQVIEEEKEEPEVASEEIIVENPVIAEEKDHDVIELKQEITVVKTITESKQDRTIIEEKKTSHLMALRQKISNKENNEKAQNHASSLSSMINLMNKNRQNNDNNKSTQIEPKSEVVDESYNKKKEKKSLFSWFKKKKLYALTTVSAFFV